jgi:hypothetical protein
LAEISENTPNRTVMGVQAPILGLPCEATETWHEGTPPCRDVCAARRPRA